jgi:hypothetical protein
VSRSLGLAIVLYSLALAAICAGMAATNARRSPVVGAGLALVELTAIIQGLLDALALVRGQHGSEVATNTGYLLTSVAILPLTASAVRLDPGRWGSAGLAVVSIRLQQTLGSAHV